jgi:anti-anti-sigma factor
MAEISIFRPQGRLDSVTGPAFEAEIARSLAAGADKLLLDLAALDYISSAGLRIILSTAKQMKSRSGRLVLCSLSVPIREVFDISGFSGILEILPSREEAMNELK